VLSLVSGISHIPTASIRGELQLSMLYISRPNPQQTFQSLSAVPPLGVHHAYPQSFLPSKSPLVQEINGLADGNDIDKWYNSRQSLWAMLYFCEFDQETTKVYYIYWI
jgi:hypothetical protein